MKTASTPENAGGNDVGSQASPVTRVTPGNAFNFEAPSAAGSRVNTRTDAPAADKACTHAEPHLPVPPATRNVLSESITEGGKVHVFAVTTEEERGNQSVEQTSTKQPAKKHDKLSLAKTHWQCGKELFIFDVSTGAGDKGASPEAKHAKITLA
jgi:hypothetical protein